ncbi:MAG: hypothetical protein GF418_03650 [Chitinivibrionales bacterium]|nr:hypothetical protein [Chitinivibrionales bacterium]MBD3394699.1 hypothetical protein [Chitinivibrionales bacterium]
MRTIPFFLVTGFLGSGKTTLLKRLLAAHADSRRIAVVQNEFAAGAVDGTELRQTGKPFEILEMNRGSVFCVCLLSDFTRSLRALIDRVRPDAVVLEATGLADPIAVVQLLASPELKDQLHLAHVWCIVDASSFLKMRAMMTRMVHQVRVADTVVINKIDTNPEAEKEIREAIAGLNPFAETVATSYCDFSLEMIFCGSAGEPVAVKRQDENAGFESCGRPETGSAVVRTTQRISREALDAFLAAAVPSTYRCKGYVVLDNDSAVCIQSCFGSTKVESVGGYVGPTEIIVMGPAVSAGEVQKAFEYHTAAGQVPR